ncbi:136_t:CDS:1 [Paraglomus brasilianum]|uniref:136_t:CDS:1 n=1 Tax=Paraglomus brasilianum TaxID=144538 RepID=A0A9N9FU61_9GLOM|nr:136_t:CDS:1 [Paraglomus brasilianum]
MKKLNFSGGEPFLKPKYLAELLQYSKTELQLESVSIVSNGSKIERKFLEKYKAYVDILAISCDSFNERTNQKIGRGKGTHVHKITQISQWCQEYGIKFKLNTVVNKYNWEEDMNVHIEHLRPFRWKCFQVLILENENGGNNTLRDAREFVITHNEFQSFIDRHQQHTCIVPEPNNVMMNSYLILDEHLCFLNCTDNDKRPSDSLLHVDIQTALKQAGWDQCAFVKRSGVYAWSKNNNSCGSASSDNRLDW